MPFTFNPNDLHRLNKLAFALRCNPTEHNSGERRLRRSGDGFDFLDYRAYVRGDDVRKIDWSLYGRFRQLFVRLNEAPRQTSITFVVDSSASMGFGTQVTKMQQAQSIACGLAFVALRGGDRVYLHVGTGPQTRVAGPFSGARQHRRIVDAVALAEPIGQCTLQTVVQRIAARRVHRGLVVVLSDFLGTGPLEQPLASIGAAGGRIVAIQILDPMDGGATLSPGVIRLRDSETGEMVQVRIDAEVLADFRHRFDAEQALLRRQFTSRGHHFLLTHTGDDYLLTISRALSSGAIQR